MSMVISPWFPFGASGANDPYFANTVLLIGPSNGVGSTSVSDESFAAHAALTSPGINNDAQVSNSVTLFGSPTMKFDSGHNDEFEAPDHADWTGGTQLRTIEGFFYLLNAAEECTFISHYDPSGNRGWQIQYRGDLGTPAFNFVASNDGTATTTIGGNITLSASTWYYFCYERAASNVHRVYTGPLGGTASMLVKSTNAIDIFNSTSLLHICGNNNLAGNYNGYSGEIRITNGVARYATDAGFPVPTAKFPRS